MTIAELKKKFPSSWKDIVKATNMRTVKSVIDERRRLRRVKMKWAMASEMAKNMKEKAVRDKFLEDMKPSRDDSELIEILGI